MSSISGRTRTPIRDLSREENKPGEVTSYRMSPEELEDYRTKTGYKAPTLATGVEMKRPIQLANRDPKTNKPEPAPAPPSIDSKPKKEPQSNRRERSEGPDRIFVLRRIAEGRTIASIERETGIYINGMYYYLKKWNLTGISPEKAKEILIEEGVYEVKNDQSIPPEGYKAKGHDCDREEIEKLIQRFTLLDEEKDATIKRLIVERESDRKLATKEISEMREDRDNWRNEAMAARQAVLELQNERALILQTIEHAEVPHENVDMVNSPAHYTAGGIEVINFIVAKLTAEEFTGYCKGNIIKYIARANLKGGIEDLRKCRWYVNRLLSEVAE